MNNNCEFAGSGCCMCSACQSMREALEEAGKITKEEIEALFCEAEEMMKKCGSDNK